MQSDVELTILMPCLNEAETVASCVTKARQWIERSGVMAEILVADNGSTDGSRELASAAGARVVPITERGYGAALAGGIQAAKGRYVVMGDADDSYDFQNLEPFLEKLRAGYHLVMGNRFKGGVSKGAMPPLHYYFGNPAITAFGRLLFRSPCGDFFCGLRGFDREAILAMDLRTQGMEFAIEMVVRSTLNRLRITEVPTTLVPDGRSGGSHLRSWRDGWRTLRFLLMYSPRWLFFFPGIALMVLGFAGMIWLVPGPRHIGHTEFDVHTLLGGGAMIVIGYQALLFAILTKVFGIEERLLPPSPNFDRALRYVTLETGLVVGAGLAIAGLSGVFYTVLEWRDTGFGILITSKTLRVFIPSVIACIIGSQTVLASFFLSILGLKRR